MTENTKERRRATQRADRRRRANPQRQRAARATVRAAATGHPAQPVRARRGCTPSPATTRSSLVWVAMSVVYLILMPTRFGSWGAFSSIFGSQQVLVFLAMSAMITLVVGEFDLSIASVMGISATLVPVLAGVHGWNIWLACLVGDGRLPARRRRQRVLRRRHGRLELRRDPRHRHAAHRAGPVRLRLEHRLGQQPAAQRARDPRDPRHAGVVLLRHRPRGRPRLRARLDPARAQHDLRRREPGGRPTGWRPGATDPDRRLPRRAPCLPGWPASSSSPRSAVSTPRPRRPTCCRPSPPSSSAPPSCSRGCSTRSARSSPSTSSRPASSACSCSASRDGSRTSSTAPASSSRSTLAKVVRDRSTAD